MTTSRSDDRPSPLEAEVIIVDDDRDTREMLAMALQIEGFEVTQAANGLRLISSLHVHRPDIILLDVNMSWIDGFELCRAVRQNEQFQDIPVLFVSAREARGRRGRRGIEAGAADYFVKPWTGRARRRGCAS